MGNNLPELRKKTDKMELSVKRSLILVLLVWSLLVESGSYAESDANDDASRRTAAAGRDGDSTGTMQSRSLRQFPSSTRR